MCSTPAPLAYSVSSTAAHLVAAPIYIVAFYTLYVENSQSFKFYKKYLAVHAISNFIFELYITVVLKPVLYLPFPVIRFTGISVLRFLNGGISLFIFILISIALCWSIIELFEYRFRLLLKTNLCSIRVTKYAKIAKVVRWALIAMLVCTISTLPLCVSGLFDQVDHKKKLEIDSKFPEILCMSAITLPKPSASGIKPIHVFNIFAMVSIIIGISLSLSQGIMSLVALNEMVHQLKTSLRTIAIHKSFIISLFCQISVHYIMLGFPITVYIIAVVCNFDGNAVGYVAVVVASLHGAMSTLAMIIFNRPLYEKARLKFLSVFTLFNVTVQDFSVISMINSR